MFIVLAVLVLLPLLGVAALVPITGWLMVVAYIIIGFSELKK